MYNIMDFFLSRSMCHARGSCGWMDGTSVQMQREAEGGEGREAGACVGDTVAGVAVHGSSPGAVTPAVFALDTLRPPYVVKGCGLSAAPQRALEMYFSHLCGSDVLST